jgi:hypothetical protein
MQRVDAAMHIVSRTVSHLAAATAGATGRLTHNGAWWHLPLAVVLLVMLAVVIAVASRRPSVFSARGGGAGVVVAPPGASTVADVATLPVSADSSG